MKGAPKWPKNKSLCVAMAVYDAVEIRTVRSLMSLERTVKNFNLHMRVGTYIDLSRSTIIQEVRDWDYVLFVDSDIAFTPADVVHLMRAYKPRYGAITGSYPYRDGSGRTTCGWLGEDGKWIDDQAATLKAIEHSKKEECVPVDKLPGGFLLTTKETIAKLPAPAFACRWVQDTLESGTKVARFVGEDVYFGELLKQLGFEPHAHFGVQVGHIGKIPLGLMGVEITPQEVPVA